jgi:hypothetical protein
MKPVNAIMKSLLPALAVACWVTHAFAQCSETVYIKPNEERAALLVDSIEGNALFSLVEGPGDHGTASDLCIALFTEEGLFVAKTTTSLKGEFSFSGVLLPVGRYRLIASSKAFKDLYVLIELKQTPDTDPEKRNRIHLHMRLKSLRSPTYATLSSAKEYQDRER